MANCEAEGTWAFPNGATISHLCEPHLHSLAQEVALSVLRAESGTSLGDALKTAPGSAKKVFELEMAPLVNIRPDVGMVVAQAVAHIGMLSRRHSIKGREFVAATNYLIRILAIANEQEDAKVMKSN